MCCGRRRFWSGEAQETSSSRQIQIQVQVLVNIFAICVSLRAVNDLSKGYLCGGSLVTLQTALDCNMTVLELRFERTVITR